MEAARRVVVIALCCAGSLCGVTLGQESDQPEGEAAAARTPDEEVIVRGSSRAALRIQIRRAEEAVYERFNEINSDDEFDIHCRLETITGSKIPRRMCQPNFLRTAQENAARETILGMQGGIASTGQEFSGLAHAKRLELGAEMRRLASQDEQLLDSLMRLVRLEQRMDERRNPGAEPSSLTTATRQLTGEEGSLPYGAARLAEARIGERPWRHVLIHRTFAIAHVYGEIDSVEVECPERTEALSYEAGAEWTLPEDWGACALVVEAPPGTTFALYEFE